jgi:hypothetical protein
MIVSSKFHLGDLSFGLMVLKLMRVTNSVTGNTGLTGRRQRVDNYRIVILKIGKKK